MQMQHVPILMVLLLALATLVTPATALLVPTMTNAFSIQTVATPMLLAQTQTGAFSVLVTPATKEMDSTVQILMNV